MATKTSPEAIKAWEQSVTDLQNKVKCLPESHVSQINQHLLDWPKNGGVGPAGIFDTADATETLDSFDILFS